MGMIGGRPVIHSLGDESDIISCISVADSTNEVMMISISLPLSLTQNLPAIPVDPPVTPMRSVDGKAFSDQTVCNFKFAPSDETCAKGYRAFGEVPQNAADTLFGMTMVSWNNFGLYPWHPGLANRQLGFHFYFGTLYDEVVSIHRGWSSDNRHVEENSNLVVQRPLNPALFPQDYLSAGPDGARPAVGGLMFDKYEVSGSAGKKNFLLWGYSDSRTTFIRPTLVTSAFREMAEHCTLDGNPGDALDSPGSGSEIGMQFISPLLNPCARAQWCFPIKQPDAFVSRGRYPQTYCIQYDSENTSGNEEGRFTVLLKDFREAQQWLDGAVPVEITSAAFNRASNEASDLAPVYPLMFMLLFAYVF